MWLEIALFCVAICIVALVVLLTVLRTDVGRSAAPA